MHSIPNRMCELKHNRAKHKSRTRNAKCNADSHRYGIRSSDGRIDARALSDITNYSTHRKRLEAPSLGKAAKLESRPENANRANPELRALGHQTPGRAEWGKKTRTRQNGSSCEQRSRSSLERSLREMRTRTSHGQTKGARAKRPLNGKP